MPWAQQQLWQALRLLQLNVRREAPLGKYTVDFVQLAAKLVVEVDGYWHGVGDRPSRDVERDKWIASQGYEVIRIPDADVKENVNVVAARIAAGVAAPIAKLASTPPPSGASRHLPPSRGNED